ncbi:MAG: acetyl-coenzyme A synthetase, partial [Chloroflexi bacterium]
MFSCVTPSQDHAIETMQVEERRYKPSPEFSGQANAQPDIYQRGFDEFWTHEAARITWSHPWKGLYEWKPPYAKWYLGGKLNVCYNCVDRHVEAGIGDKVAYFWEGEPEDDRREITFRELQKSVVRAANGLKKIGVKKGTHVAIYM